MTQNNIKIKLHDINQRIDNINSELSYLTDISMIELGKNDEIYNKLSILESDSLELKNMINELVLSFNDIDKSINDICQYMNEHTSDIDTAFTITKYLVSKLGVATEKEMTK